MKIVVTGATSFVGSQLVPLLACDGHELLLVDRDVSRLRHLFPRFARCDYADLVDSADKFDLLIHLDVLNSNEASDTGQFMQVNVELFRDVLLAARRARISRIVHVSTFQVLSGSDHSAYAASRREALRIAREENSLDVVVLFLPVAHGDLYAGKFSVLNRLPKKLASATFRAASSLAPTISISHIASFVTKEVIGIDPDKDVFLVDPKSENSTYLFFKKTTDLGFALVTIFLFWWLMVLAWVWIRLTSKGPGIFAQERVGKGGKTFICYKFRTLKMNTQQVATHEMSASAITSAGRFLRRTKVDELPQIWNILRGEISLVGPRPCLPVQNDLIEERKIRGVREVTPGITGYAQINGVDMSDPEKLAIWDQRYLYMRSLTMDLKIMLATVVGRGQGDKVMR